jgi:hypothetical protein
MPLVSSLLHTPCKSGSPHGVFGTVYLIAGPPLYAVITSGGALWLCPEIERESAAIDDIVMKPTASPRFSMT